MLQSTSPPTPALTAARAGHHAARRREDAGAEPRQHFGHIVAPK
jgi:hypothetical protein